MNDQQELEHYEEGNKWLDEAKENFDNWFEGMRTLAQTDQQRRVGNAASYSWFSHDVTKIRTKKLSLLLSFYFHVILEHLKRLKQTNFRFKRVLCFAIQDA